MSVAFKCQRCGWCCQNVVINITYSDIVRWLSEDRKGILQEISFIDNYPRKGTGGFYIAKTAFNPKQSCPFLEMNNRVATCKIHSTKPKACQDYPLSSHCPNFNETPPNLEQIKRGQIKDFKMAFNNRRILLNALIEARRQ